MELVDGPSLAEVLATTAGAKQLDETQALGSYDP